MPDAKDESGYELFNTHHGGPMLVIFGGVAMGFVLPPFEFRSFIESLSVTTLLVRDTSQAWYQRGVAGLGDDIPSAAAALRGHVVSHTPSRLVLMGNSAGGFAAMRFGLELADIVDAVIAFSPQTCLRARWRTSHRDRRWEPQVTAAQLLVGRESDELDAARWQDPWPPVDLHFALGNRLDMSHALHVARTGRIRLRPHVSRSHRLVAELRDKARLSDLVRERLEPS